MSRRARTRRDRRDRWRHLNKTGEALTPQEIAAGWHYCHDWDGLLIHPGDPEAECCSCRPEADQSLEPAEGHQKGSTS